MKARATLLMVLPNKDQLKFHSYQDAKLLMEAIEKSIEGCLCVSRLLKQVCSASYLPGSSSSSDSESQFNLVSYKAGLESIEARLAYYKKNEVVFEESINVLKLEVRLRDNALNEYKMNLEKAEKERDQLKQTLEKFQNSSKSLNNILESQVIDKFKTGLAYDAATAASPAVKSFVNLTDNSESDKGYQSVPPPLSGNFIPCKPDLTFMDEIVESENLDVTTVVTPSNVKTVENKGVSNTVKSNTVRRECCAPINEELVSDGKKKTVFPTVSKIEFVEPKQPEKPVRKPVKYAEMYRSRATVNAAKPKAVHNAVKRNRFHDVKASSCWGRKITKIDQNPGILLVQHDAEIQGRHKHEPEFDFDAANVPVTTAGAEISTASPEVKTIGDSIEDIVAETLVYIRRSATKAKDKGLKTAGYRVTTAGSRLLLLLRMTKVLKGEFEKLEDLKVKDVSLTCDTSLEVFNNEFNRLSGMDNDLFTYEVANILCDSNKDDDSKQRISHEADDNMRYDPSDVAFTEWLGLKKFNYKTTDHYTKKSLWIYWIRGDDKVELTDEEFSDNEDEVAKKNDGYCNGGNLPGAYIVGDSLHYQDYEWYEALKDSELKEQALRNKAIMKGLISDDESSSDGWRRWESHEITYHDHELPVCNMRRFKMNKYSFGQDKEYVAVKEDEYDDLGRTSNDTCRAYQEIFRMMDEGWMVTRAE
ncbi:hypothetical protein Tco_1070412 [Tanacetum coccineum]|uniref:Uncharacterized protein n=1 Tax=Tanacetum coccineum TaxID=301880 RepID=A0ABQ5HN90_9ASTR